MSETLTIVLRADGSGLTGTIKASAEAVRDFGLKVDQAGKQAEGAGQRSRRAARDIDELDRSSRRNSGTMREWASGLNTLKGTLATLGISVVAREMLGAGLAMDRLERSTAAALGSQALAARELAFVRQEAQRLGIYFPVLAQGYAGLAAATRGTSLAGEKTREIFLAVAEAGRAMNLTQEQIQGTLTALQQIAGKGTVSMEELRQQLGDRLPGAMQIAARSMNMTVAEFTKMVSEGKVLSEDFLPKFAGELRKASAAGVLLAQNSPAAEFERLRTALFDVGAAVARGGVLDTLATGARALTAALNALVASGALVTIVSLLTKIALVAAVMYAGGKLAVGLRFLQGLWLAQATVVNTAMLSVVGLAGATTRLTVAQTAAAVATRGLSTAMAFLQANPIMLVVTAVALLAAAWFNARREAEEATRVITTGFVEAKNAYDEFARAPSFEGIATLETAKQEMQALTGVVEDLRDKADAASQSYARSMARFGYASDESMKQASAALADAEGRLRALQEASNRATDAMRDELQQMAGLASVTPQVREQLAALARQTLDNTVTKEDLAKSLANIAHQGGNVQRGMYLAANGFDEARTAAAAFKDVLSGVSNDIDSALVKLTQLQKGEYAAWMLKQGQKINAAGGPDAMTPAEREEFNRQAAVYKTLLDQIATQEEANAKARKAATAATREATKAQRDHNRELAQQARYAQEAERAEAALQGPLKVAEVEHRQRIAFLTAELGEHNLKQAEFNRLKAVADEQLRRTTAEIQREADVLGRVREEYDQQIYLAGLSAEQRRVEEQVWRELNEAIRANQELSPQQIEDLRALIREKQRDLDLTEAQQHAAEDFRNSWQNAVSSVSSAFADWMTGGIKSFKDFGRALVDIARRFIADIIAKFAQGQLTKIFGGWMNGVSNWMGSLSSGSGWGGVPYAAGQSGSGGLWSSMSNMVTGGNGFSFAGIAKGFMEGFSNGGGTGFWSNLMNGFTGAVSTFTSGLSSAAVATSSYGQAINGLAATYGGTGVGGAGAAGGAGGGAAALGAVAWVAVIAAAMYQGAQWYKQGWQYGKEGNADANIDYKTPGSKIVIQTHKELEKLGFNNKWASILSGSSGVVRMLGHKQPELRDQGWEGTVNMDGWQGRQYANIHRAGGWFRSDKNWTEWRDASSDLTQYLSRSTSDVRSQISELASALPSALQAAMDRISFNPGKLTLDRKNPENNEKIIGEYVMKLREGLAGEAIKAMGLGRLLDDGFSASEVMGALSASIALVTGGADKLGRALTALEIENVGRAVEYFQGLAAKNGTSLGDEVQRVVGTLDEYSRIVAGADAQIRTANLNPWQRAQLEIETTYRNQVKSLNALAKSLGLSGARAEDLAKIEQLRALNMANLQKQMEEQRDTFLADLGLTELSPLTDREKLNESMQMLRDAVSTGDLGRAQQLSQTALGLGRNLFASGADYNSLYNEVTGLVRGIGLPTLDATDMGDLADILIDLPQDIATALFNLLYTPATPADVAPPVVTPPGTGGGGNRPGGGGGGRPGGGGGRTQERLLAEAVSQLFKIASNTGQAATAATVDRLNSVRTSTR